MKLRSPSKPFARSVKAALAGSVAAALAIFAAQTARADNTWDGGGGGTFLWSNNVNWGGDTLPSYGTLTFMGATGTTNILNGNFTTNGNTAMNQVSWNGTSAWVMNNANGAILSLFDNSGTQAKLESLGTGSVTINAPITFGATAGNNWGEINAVSSSMTFGSAGGLNITGPQVAGIRLFGGSTAISTSFDNAVNASGKYFSTSAVGQTVNIGGSFTAANFYVMNTGTLNLNSGGSLNSTIVRLGGDFGTTGTQNQTLSGTFNLTPAAGGVTYAGIVNSVSGNSSGTLAVNSQNTSGTNTLSNQIALDSPLKITQAAGGTLAITQARNGLDTISGTDIKGNTLTFTPAATGAINHSGTIYNSTGSGSVTMNGAGTLTLSGANTYIGATIISAGTLAAAAANALGGTSGITLNTGGTLLLSNSATTNRIKDSALITMAGGTIAFSGNITEGSSAGTGALTLTMNSIIDFAGGNDVINFGASGTGNPNPWTAGTTLSIYNWAGSATGGGSDRLLFGSAPGDASLTTAQLGQITFFSGTGTGFLGTGAFAGSLGEVVPVPEPSSFLGALAMLGLAGWRERRRRTA